MPYGNKGRKPNAAQAEGLKLGPIAAKKARDQRKADAEHGMLTHAEHKAAILAKLPEGEPSPGEGTWIEQLAFIRRGRDDIDALMRRQSPASATYRDNLKLRLDLGKQDADITKLLAAETAVRVAATIALVASQKPLVPPERRRARAAAVYKLLARQGALDLEAREIALDLGHGEPERPGALGAKNDEAHAHVNRAAQLRGAAGQQTPLDMEERVIELEWIRAEKEGTDTPDRVAEWKAAKAEINNQRERPD